VAERDLITRGSHVFVWTLTKWLREQHCDVDEHYKGSEVTLSPLPYAQVLQVC